MFVPQCMLRSKTTAKQNDEELAEIPFSYFNIIQFPAYCLAPLDNCVNAEEEQGGFNCVSRNGGDISQPAHELLNCLCASCPKSTDSCSFQDYE